MNSTRVTSIPSTIATALQVGRAFKKLRPHLKRHSYRIVEQRFSLPIHIVEQCYQLSQLPDCQLFVMIMDDLTHLEQHDDRWNQETEMDWQQVRVERMERILNRFQTK